VTESENSPMRRLRRSAPNAEYVLGHNGQREGALRLQNIQIWRDDQPDSSVTSTRGDDIYAINSSPATA
jgi:hypothetical protein